jgi:hypothetical protein
MFPCRYGGYGAGLLAAVAYLLFMESEALEGLLPPLIFTGFVGAGLLLYGLIEALSCDDPLTPPSARDCVVAAGIVVVSIYALAHGWPFDGDEDPLLLDLGVAWWVGWMAFGVWNIWLPLRGLCRRYVAALPELALLVRVRRR